MKMLNRQHRAFELQEYCQILVFTYPNESGYRVMFWPNDFNGLQDERDPIDEQGTVCGESCTT
jgi:hypothetical protein